MSLIAVQARISELRALTTPTPVPTVAASDSANGFAAALAAASGAGTQSPAGGPADPKPLGEQAVALAKEYIGVPYKWGGTDPATGLDCSALVQLVYKRLGVELPRVSRDQARAGEAVPSLAQARPGDLVFFNSPVDHVGIYLGDGKMLDAPRSGKDVAIRDVWATPTHIRRVTGSAGVGASTPSTQGFGPGSVPFADLFVAAGRRHGVDPALLAAVARAESGFRPDAVSPAGARGLMQIMPGTARGLGVDPMVPAHAVDGAARLLSGYLRDYRGRADLALAAYNAGPGAVRKHGGVPPYEETRTYIQRVTRFWEDYR